MWDIVVSVGNVVLFVGAVVLGVAFITQLVRMTVSFVRWETMAHQKRADIIRTAFMAAMKVCVITAPKTMPFDLADGRDEKRAHAVAKQMCNWLTAHNFPALIRAKHIATLYADYLNDLNRPVSIAETFGGKRTVPVE